MIKIYSMAIALAFIVGAYFYGYAAGRAAARTECATTAAHSQNNIIKTMERIDVETITTDVPDIRRVLRARYTIGAGAGDVPMHTDIRPRP